MHFPGNDTFPTPGQMALVPLEMHFSVIPVISVISGHFPGIQGLLPYDPCRLVFPARKCRKLTLSRLSVTSRGCPGQLGTQGVLGPPGPRTAVPGALKWSLSGFPEV